ncbi:MAG: ATP-dependent Clp protease proteolytic subunit [Edaphobacter sp.]
MLGGMAEETEPDKKKFPEEMWAAFCGDINANNAAKFINGITTVGMNGTKKLHVLFQSWGGFVGDGVFLYNTLRKFPVEVVLYNAGQVASAATLAYLGAKGRKTTANAIFMIHKASYNADTSGAGRLKGIANNLSIDDARIEVILREHLGLPDELWNQFLFHDVFLSGEDAIKYGMADEIAEFSPPPGVNILNALG